MLQQIISAADNDIYSLKVFSHTSTSMSETGANQFMILLKIMQIIGIYEFNITSVM